MQLCLAFLELPSYHLGRLVLKTQIWWLKPPPSLHQVHRLTRNFGGWATSSSLLVRWVMGTRSLFQLNNRLASLYEVLYKKLLIRLQNHQGGEEYTMHRVKQVHQITSWTDMDTAFHDDDDASHVAENEPSPYDSMFLANQMTAFLGLYTLLCHWPPLLLLHWLKWELLEIPPLNSIAMLALVANGVCASIYNCCLMLAITILGPVIASCGIMLTIPGTMILSWISSFYDTVGTPPRMNVAVIFGNVLVMAGFAVLSIRCRPHG